MSYAYYNPNPARRSVGDCAVRALSKALDQTWEETYAGLALEGFIRGDLPNADSVWGPYLKARGFTRHFIPDDNPNGTFILSMPGRHVLAAVDGVLYDSWDSGGEIPVYYWTKET